MNHLEKLIARENLSSEQLMAIIKSTGTTSTENMAIKKMKPFFDGLNINELVAFYDKHDEYALQKATLSYLTKCWQKYAAFQLVQEGIRINKKHAWEAIFNCEHFVSWLKTKRRNYVYTLGNKINIHEIWSVIFRTNRLSFDQMVSAVASIDWRNHLIENLCAQIRSRHNELSVPKLILLGRMINHENVWKTILQLKRLSLPKLLLVNKLTNNRFLFIIVNILGDRLKSVATKQLKEWATSCYYDEVVIAVIKTGKLPRSVITDIYNNDSLPRSVHEECVRSHKLGLEFVPHTHCAVRRETESEFVGGCLDKKFKKASSKTLIELAKTFAFDDEVLDKIGEFLNPKLKSKPLQYLLKVGKETYAWKVIIPHVTPLFKQLSKDELITIGCEADNDDVWQVIYNELRRK